MITRKAKSVKMPVLNSYYVSKFSEETLQYFKQAKPFAYYHRDTQEYEVTPEVYSRMKERSGVFKDETISTHFFEREINTQYGYQEDVVRFVAYTDSVLINFPQGMGKTYTALKVVDANQLQRTLVVCGQGNLQEEWLKEVKKWNMQHLNVRIVGEDSDCGNKKKVAWLREKNEKGIDLINIEALRNIGVVEALNAQNYDCIIVDEVQSAKGWGAEQTKGLHELKYYQCQVRIALSGTPVLNSPLEYFSVLKFLGVLTDTVKTTFDRYYGEWGFDFFGHYVCRGYKNLDDLAVLLAPILCYVDKKELGLPTKTRRKLDLAWIGHSNSEYMALSKLYTGAMKNVKAAGYKTKPKVRSDMLFLSSTAQCKIDYVMEKARKERILVFSRFTQVLDIYQEAAETEGLKVLYYHGKLSMQERLEILDKWAKGNYDLLLLSIMTARYGLNLTEATRTIFLEPPPSLSVLEQAEDRAHRIGQTNPVESDLLCCSPIDERGLENIEIKQENLDGLHEISRSNYEL